MMSESLRIPSKDEITFSLFLPPKIASAVRQYGDVTIFDASASFLSLPEPPTSSKQHRHIKFSVIRKSTEQKTLNDT